MIRILLADDNEVLRWGLVQNLSSEPDMVVVAEVDEARRHARPGPSANQRAK